MKQFKRVYIEITNICNLRCSFCPPTSRKAEHMSPAVFLHILKQIKTHTGYIYLHVKGEPLLHPELDKILDLSFEEGFQVNITTNGTLINKIGQMLLTKPAVRQINFSLHSINSDSQDDYIQSILSFTKDAIVKTKMFVALRLWNLSEHNDENQDQRKNENVLEQIEREFKLDYKIKETLGVEKGIKITDRVYVNQDRQFKWPDLNENQENHNGFCYGLRNHVAILVDGSVVPCCLDNNGIINLGNIHQTPFSDIIESKRANDIVDGFSRKEPVEKLCQKCGYMKRFR